MSTDSGVFNDDVTLGCAISSQIPPCTEHQQILGIISTFYYSLVKSSYTNDRSLQNQEHVVMLKHWQN